MPSEAGSTTMQSLERAIDVLEVLENARVPLRLSEIARRAELHVATTQRILAVLERRGRVEHDGDARRRGPPCFRSDLPTASLTCPRLPARMISA